MSNEQNYESKFYDANLCSSHKGWDDMQALFKEVDKELEAKDREITKVKVSRKAALSREVEANTNWSKEALKWAKELEAKDREIKDLTASLGTCRRATGELRLLLNPPNTGEG